MYYCERCYHFNDRNHCEFCGEKDLAEIKGNDYVFLIEKEIIFAEFLKEALDNYHIKYHITKVKNKVKETYRFFVPYYALSVTKKIVERMY